MKYQSQNNPITTNQNRRFLQFIRCPSWLTFLFLASLVPFSTVLNAQDPGGDLPFDGLFLLDSEDVSLAGSDGALTFPSNLPPLEGPAMAYDADSVSPGLVLFGGYNPQTAVYSNSTWIFDGTDWVEQSPTTSPPVRYLHEMVYDSVNDVVVLFGGLNSGGALNDTWIWDGSDWTLQSPGTSPSARYYFGMAFDAAREEVVLFGGQSTDAARDNDTWVWNTATESWEEKASVETPSGRRYHALGYDSTNSKILLYGGDTNRTQTWLWDGTNWELQSPSSNPSDRYFHTIEDDPVRGGLVMFGGQFSGNFDSAWFWDGSDWTELPVGSKPEARYNHTSAYHPGLGGIVVTNGRMSSGTQRSDTWALGSEATAWENLTGDILYFDMSEKPNGVWHYTTIDVPNWVEVRFLNNAANTPVFWLATEEVLIDGTLNLDGEDPDNNNEAGTETEGGPGGFDGGLGGTRFDVSSTYAGAPGSGPGGGNPGVTSGESGFDGEFAGAYGTASQIPLIGGSGGGGGASNATQNGGEGGAGGGAILIASAADITVNGAIYARGGNRVWSGTSYGGHGSGGAIRLVADRVKGIGKLDARSGNNSGSGPSLGRVRVEAFYRTILDDNTGIFPTATAGAPTSEIGNVLEGDQPALIITSVAGTGVLQPPTGSSATPDVVFQESGSITVVVTGVNIPDGTPVNLRITTSGQVINLPGPGNPQVPLAGGIATFTVFVPAGLGNIQASAEFTP